RTMRPSRSRWRSTRVARAASSPWRAASSSSSLDRASALMVGSPFPYTGTRAEHSQPTVHYSPAAADLHGTYRRSAREGCASAPPGEGQGIGLILRVGMILRVAGASEASKGLAPPGHP